MPVATGTTGMTSYFSEEWTKESLARPQALRERNIYRRQVFQHGNGIRQAYGPAGAAATIAEVVRRVVLYQNFSLSDPGQSSSTANRTGGSRLTQPLAAFRQILKKRAQV